MLKGRDGAGVVEAVGVFGRPAILHDRRPFPVAGELVGDLADGLGRDTRHLGVLIDGVFEHAVAILTPHAFDACAVDRHIDIEYRRVNLAGRAWLT